MFRIEASKKSKGILIHMSLIIFLITCFNTYNYGAELSPRVIYEVEWQSDTSAQVSLSWSDINKQTPIRITSWRINEDETVTIKYQQGDQVVQGFHSRIISDLGLSYPCIFILEEDLGVNSVEEVIFPDLPTDAEGKLAISHLYYLGIINGYTDGNFKPSGNVSRAEFAKILYLSGKMEANLNYPLSFTDVSSSHWAKNYIYTLASKEIVEGKGNNQFDPNGTITIAEVLAIIDRSFILYGGGQSYEYTLNEHWSDEYFLSLVDKGILMKTDSYYSPYKPNQTASRKDCAILLSRVLKNYHEMTK
jgi:hypothetical protein